MQTALLGCRSIGELGSVHAAFLRNAVAQYADGANRLLHAIKGFVPTVCNDVMVDHVTAVEILSKTGSVTDTSPPAPPLKPVAVLRNDGTVELTWSVQADFESGVGGFVILRDGMEVATQTRNMGNRPGRVVLQGRSYHDTPEKPLSELRYTDRSAKGSAKYELLTLNGQGLRSQPAVAEWKTATQK